jgi:probable HAF family extracellular repeat protein
MGTHFKTILAIMLAVAVFCPGYGALASTSYTLTDIGALAANNAAQAWDINEAGQVAGRSYNTSNPVYNGFVWSDGSMQSMNVTVTSNSIPGINDAGQVVGDGYNNHAFLWTNGSFQDLGTLAGGSNSSASGVNNVGQVVGISDVIISGVTQRHAFLWSQSDGMRDLGSLGGVNTLSSARRINDSGQLVGYYMGTDGRQHAFIWSSESGMKDLGVLANGSLANGINDKGEVVGESGGGFSSFYWSDATGAVYLDTFGSNRRIYAYDINDAGQIVGYGSPAPGSGDRAVLWDSYLSDAVDLNTICQVDGWILREATGINDKGQITGWMQSTTSAELHAFVLTPVPLPPAVFLLGSGLAGFGFLRRKIMK